MSGKPEVFVFSTGGRRDAKGQHQKIRFLDPIILIVQAIIRNFENIKFPEFGLSKERRKVVIISSPGYLLDFSLFHVVSINILSS